jgi:RNA polymerase sigma factor (sigma-70 family)
VEPDDVIQPTTPHRGASEQPTLRDLSALAAAGDHGAFEQLHRRVGAGLRRLFLKRSAGREELVDELCQKTWTSVWKALSEGKYDPGRAAITTFVYAVGNNAWLTHLRSFARDRGYISGAPAMLDQRHMDSTRRFSGAQPDDAHDQAEAIECVRACLREGGPAGLTDQERAIVREIAAGESDRGLARRLGLSSSTVNIRKHAGYAKIRAYLRSMGLEDDEGAEADEDHGHDAHATQPETGISGVGGGGGGPDTALAADHAWRLP